MWFALGLVTLVLGIVAALLLRRRSAWRGSGEALLVDGRTLRYERGESKNKGKVIARQWGVVLPGDYAFRLHDEGWLDRYCRGIGVNAERSVGYQPFDEAFFIESDDERVIDVLRHERSLRDRLLALRRALLHDGLGASAWYAAGGRLWLEASGGAEVTPGRQREIVAVLHEFSNLLGDAPTRRHDPFVRRAVVVLAINAGVIVLAVATLIRASSGRTDLVAPWAMFWAVLLPALALAAGLLVLAARWLRNSARAHRVLAELLLLGVPALVIGSYGLLREANMALDASAAAWQRIERASTEHHTYRCGRRNRSTCHEFRLRLPAGLDGQGAPITLLIPRAEYARLPERGPVEVDLRPGALGFGWVAGTRPVAESKSS